MRDRYYTTLTQGMRVADLRDGKSGEGRVVGPAGHARILVQWDDGDEEAVFEGDVVAASAMHVRRRRGS